MKKEVMISEILSKLDDLGVSYNIGKDTDISINCEFENNNSRTTNKNIKYFASVYFNEAIKTVFMWELTKEKKNGFVFQEQGETSFHPAKAQFCRVNAIKYDIDGNCCEYILDLESISKTFKDTARKYGWIFKMVLKREKALYPLIYFGDRREGCRDVLLKEDIEYSVLYWTLFSILLIFDFVLFIGGSGMLFLALSILVLSVMLILKKKISLYVMKLLYSFLIAFIGTFIIFAIIRIKG